MSGHCNICGAWGCVEASCPQARPGSETAREHGCTCAVIDNHYGRGYLAGEDGPLFLYNADCPLHGESWDDEEYGRGDVASSDLCE